MHQPAEAGMGADHLRGDQHEEGDGRPQADAGEDGRKRPWEEHPDEKSRPAASHGAGHLHQKP